MAVPVTIKLTLPRGEPLPSDLLYAALDPTPGAAGLREARVVGRLKAAFDLYLNEFRGQRYPAGTSTSEPLLQWSARSTSCKLFPLSTANAAKVTGRDRDLPAQLALSYEGTRGGVDALLEWRIEPLGALVSDAVIYLDGGGELTEGGVRFAVSDVLIDELGVHKLTASECEFEVHKLVAFTTWLEWRYANGAEWRFFPRGKTFDALPPAQQSMARAIYGTNGAIRDRRAKLHRGFLLYGPAGTGKSSAVREAMLALRMSCVWGWDEGKTPVVGSGAALRGGLQGDLEMRIYALFMRARAAPWLPTAITIDELDFTAPSRRLSKPGDGGGGDLWLQLLSDHERRANVVFIATTNLRINILEQLVDRLDNHFVGVLDWRAQNRMVKEHFNAAKLPTSLGAEWYHLRGIDGGYGAFVGHQAYMLGMTPRAVKSVTCKDDLLSRQRESNPWPTLFNGTRTLYEIYSRTEPLHDSCVALLEFLLEAFTRSLLTGRMLIDLTRLREQLIVVDVEVLRSGQNPSLLMERSTMKTAFESDQEKFEFLESLPGTDPNLVGKAFREGNTDITNEAVRRKLGFHVDRYYGEWQRKAVSVPLKYKHVHGRDRQGKGRSYARTFVLREQADELGLWQVLAQVALYLHATHCTYVSDEFLSGAAGAGADRSADERNRDAIRLTMLQYLAKCDRAVLLLPLRYARIQKLEEGALSGTSSINAHEVWDIITSGWRCDVSNAAQRKQIFALVASEECELSAVLKNAAMAWPQSDYRTRLAEQQAEERECAHCGTEFQTENVSQLRGCKHNGVLWVPLNDKEWTMVSNADAWNLKVSSQEFALATKGKWSCCGKSYYDGECPKRKHEAEADMEKAKRRQGATHEPRAEWWCNSCCNCVDQLCA